MQSHVPHRLLPLRQSTVLALVLASLALARCTRAPEPQPAPYELTPTELELAAKAASDERERWTRERDERWLEAIDPGEDHEHTQRVRQESITDGSAEIPAIFLQGEAVFEHEYSIEHGLGTNLARPRPGLSRVEGDGPLRGADAFSCRECHHRGGDDGHGELHHRAWLHGDGRTLASARPRVAPHLAGVGFIEAIAREITVELHRQRDEAIAIARNTSAQHRAPLSAKGLEFGSLVARPDGSVDARDVCGVSADLVVRPFGWHGRFATLDAFARGAVEQHMGLDRPTPTTAGESPAPPQDPDRDGNYFELSEGSLTALVTYLRLIDAPVQMAPRDPALRAAFRRGETAFERMQCASCHTPSIRLDATRVPLVATQPQGRTIDLVADHQVAPTLDRFDYTRPFAVSLFSDLRRHEMGERLRDVREADISPTVFVTRPLWGLADRGPFYLHDGSARTLDEAIARHGGEAAESASRFSRASDEERRALIVFLLGLRRAPQPRRVP